MATGNNFRTGLFIFGSVILFCAMLLVFGLSDIFASKASLHTYFEESVQGLSVGSPVKYKGVSIGSVSDISILVDDSIVRVGIEIDLNSFRNRNKEVPFDDQDDFDEFITRAVGRGLRCRLELAGITGMRYLELDYHSTGDKPARVFQADGNENDDSVYIPSEPSIFKDIARSLDTSLERISKIRFEEISDNIVKAMAEINKILNSGETRDTMAHMARITQNLEETTTAISRVVTEAKMEELAESSKKLIKELADLTASLKKETDKARLAESAESFRQAADAVRAAANAIDDRRDQAVLAFDKINQTLDAMRELINTLNEDPSAIVSGRRSGK